MPLLQESVQKQRKPQIFQPVCKISPYVCVIYLSKTEGRDGLIKACTITIGTKESILNSWENVKKLLEQHLSIICQCNYKISKIFK